MKKTLTALLLVSAAPSIASPDFNLNNRDTTQADTGSLTAKNTQSASTYDQSLLEIPISDTRGSRASTAAISSTTRMTRAQIKESGVRSVDQLLQQFAGIGFSRNGGPGSVASFYLRGAEADTTLVLLNNVRIQSINTGFSSISDLPINSIERIEVIRGAQSTLYGSAAPGGVIKIFTTPDKQRNTFSAKAGLSDQGDENASLGGSSSFGHFLMFGHAHWLNADGINTCASAAACFLAEPEDDIDGVERLNGQVGFQLFSDAGASLQVSQLYNNARNEFDGSFTNESEITQKVTSVQLKQPIGQNQSIQFDLGQFNELYRSLLDANGSQSRLGSYGTDRFTSSLVHEIVFSGGQKPSIALISGLDYDHSSIVESNNFPKINRQSTGLFSELELGIKDATIRLGVRRDKYDEDQTTINRSNNQYASTGHLKLMLALNNRFKFKTSVGRSFNMPTFSELYFPNFGNPELGPETHVSQDIGLEYAHNAYTASLFFFRTKSKDLIVFDSATFLPQSLGQALIRGVEFMHTYSTDQFQIGGNMTYLNALNTAQGSTETRLPRRPQFQLTSFASYQMNQTLARFGMAFTGKRFDNLDNSVRVGGYTTFDIGLTQTLTQNLSLGLRVDNLFDKDYQTVFGYNQPDRSVWLDVEYALR